MPVSDQSITTFSCSSRDRQACLKKLSSLLEREPKAIFAYAHGSFVQDLSFRDLDIAVHLNPSRISLEGIPMPEPLVWNTSFPGTSTWSPS